MFVQRIHSGVKGRLRAASGGWSLDGIIASTNAPSEGSGAFRGTSSVRRALVGPYILGDTATTAWWIGMTMNMDELGR